MKIENRINEAIDDHKRETGNFNESYIIIVINLLLFDELIKSDIDRKYIHTKSRWRLKSGSFLKAEGEAILEDVFYFRGIKLIPTEKMLSDEFIIIEL